MGQVVWVFPPTLFPSIINTLLNDLGSLDSRLSPAEMEMMNQQLRIKVR